MNFEYDIRTVNSNTAQKIKTLNEWGKQGWELISVIEKPVIVHPTSNAQNTTPYTIIENECFLKRRIE
jgi:hypothetical protein